MNEKSQLLVIVLARHYSTGLGVIRSLGNAGYQVDLIASSYKRGASIIATKSKYLNKVSEIVGRKNSIKQEKVFIDEILKYVGKETRKMVLFPTDDYTTSIIDKQREFLSQYFIMPYVSDGKNESLIRCMNKELQNKIAKENGIPVPKEWVISLEQENILLPEDIVYPCFCKPLESLGGYKKEMAACKSESELLNHLKGLRNIKSNRSVLVQEFLNIEQEIDFSGICMGKEILIPAVIEKTRISQHQRGITLSGKLVSSDKIGQIKDQLIEMLKAYDYHGMFDVELNRVGDTFYFNEVNFRSGGPNYAYFASGVNLPDMCVRGLLGDIKALQNNDIEYGKTFVSEKVAWEDYMYGFMSKKELNECINSAEIKFINTSDDPEPYKMFLKQMYIKKIEKALKPKLKKIKKLIKSKTRKIKRHIAYAVKKYILQYPQYKKRNQRNLENGTERIILAGRNYISNLGMARSLGMAGYEVEIIRVFQKSLRRDKLRRFFMPEAYSKYVKAYYTCVVGNRKDRLVNLLEKIADPKQKMLLIANDDLTASIIDSHLDHLGEFYLIPNVAHQQGAIDILMNKSEQKKVAKENDLPILNSCLIQTKNGKFTIPEEITYPCFIKPNVSKNSSKSRIRKCETREELEATIKSFSRKKDIEMLVEDYIEIEKEYSLLGVCTESGECCIEGFVVEEGGHGARIGVTMIGRTIAEEELSPLPDKVRKMMNKLNYEGLFDVDLIQAKNGTIYFVELNLRYGSSGYAITESGANLPGMFADYMIYQKPINQICRGEIGKRFISEKIAIGEYGDNFLNWRNFKQKMKDVDIHFVKNDSDMAPYNHFKIFVFVTMIKRMRNKMKKNK